MVAMCQCRPFSRLVRLTFFFFLLPAIASPSPCCESTLLGDWTNRPDILFHRGNTQTQSGNSQETQILKSNCRWTEKYRRWKQSEGRDGLKNADFWFRGGASQDLRFFIGWNEDCIPYSICFSQKQTLNRWIHRLKVIKTHYFYIGVQRKEESEERSSVVRWWILLYHLPDGAGWSGMDTLLCDQQSVKLPKPYKKHYWLFL